MELSGNQFTIQGISIEEICRQFGTPVYVYDAEKIITQIGSLKTAFSGARLKIKFAAKALTNLSILALMKQHGVGVDAVSLNEAQIAMKAGHQANDINFTPNGVDFSEIEEAVVLGLQVNVDNLPSLEKFGKKYGNKYPCGIRLNPHIMAGGNLKISTGHENAKFGISIQQLVDLKDIVSRYGMIINRLHIHTGSEILEAEVFMKMSEVLFGFADEFKDVQYIDFGGGFKVAYKESDKVTDMDRLGKHLSQEFTTYETRRGRQLELWIEPGKYLVSEAGFLFSRASVVKKTPGLTFVAVDTGLNHLIRPMMYDAWHEIVNVSNPAGTAQTYTVVGNICETDTLGADRMMSEVREGDIIALLNAGAYGYAMSSNYNSRVRPAEVLIAEGKAHLIRERETIDDILKGQVNIFK
jgi:diaminopimelate decarboxylase